MNNKKYKFDIWDVIFFLLLKVIPAIGVTIASVLCIGALIILIKVW